MSKARDLRKQLVDLALEWQQYFGVAPNITNAISELDAALLVGMSESDYCAGGIFRTAVTKDFDFEFNGIRYQVTASRPSGKKGSKVKLVSYKTEKKRPFGWHRLIWILYDKSYKIQGAWEFTADDYREKFSFVRPVAEDLMAQGRAITASATLGSPQETL